MKVFDSSRIGVAQGDLDLFSEFEQGGEMWTGNGPRERRRRIEFDQAFSEPPSVQVALTLWDMDNAHNQRVNISAQAISETGFDAVFRTWLDTKVARVRVSWMAIGPVSDDDRWDVT